MALPINTTVELTDPFLITMIEYYMTGPDLELNTVVTAIRENNSINDLNVILNHIKVTFGVSYPDKTDQLIGLLTDKPNQIGQYQPPQRLDGRGYIINNVLSKRERVP